MKFKTSISQSLVFLLKHSCVSNVFLYTMWIVLSSLILLRVLTNASRIKPVVSLVYQLWKTWSCEAAGCKNLLFMENYMEVGELEIPSCYISFP